MREYRFPDESDPFGSAPYTERLAEINRASLAERGRANGQAAMLVLGSFIVLFSIGFLGAAIVDRGLENWNSVNLAYQEQRP